MKKTRIILPVLALAFAIVSAYSTKAASRLATCYQVTAGVCDTSPCTTPVQNVICEKQFAVKVQPGCSSSITCYRAN